MAWAFVVAVSGAVAVWGKHPERMRVHWIAKPLTMLAILAATAAHASLLEPGARAALFAALALSLAGDVCLMLPAVPLLAGLASFLAAHLAYLVAFALEVPWRADQLGWLLPPAIVAVAIVIRLWRPFGRYRPAVLAYVAALTAVAWRLCARWDLVAEVGMRSFALGAAGAAFFVLSDGLLAARRFAGARTPYAVELGSYFAAQLLISACTWRA